MKTKFSLPRKILREVETYGAFECSKVSSFTLPDLKEEDFPFGSAGLYPFSQQYVAISHITCQF